jgi:YbbR domain-containing protein
MNPIWPFRHLGLKALSFALALFLWLAVAGEQVVERSLRVPLELQQFPPGLEIRGDWPEFVDVRLRGPSSTLSGVSPSDVVATLDLRSAKPGPRLFQLTPEQVRTPFDVEVVQVMPSSVGLNFEKSKMRRVPVRPPIEGLPEAGYVVGAVSVDPSIVEVVGPESVVDRITEAVTEPVSVAGASAGILEQVTVGFVEPSVRLRVPRQATVNVRIVPGPAERTVTDRAVHLRNLGPGLTAQALPATVSVVLRGARQQMARLAAADVVAYVDLNRLGVGEYMLNVQIEVPPDVGVAHINPDTVRVVVALAKQ